MAVKKSQKKLKVTLRKSLIGRPAKTRAIVKSLGLGKVDSTVVHQDRPAIRGMINKIDYLLEVEEL